MPSKEHVEAAARLAHEANRAYCESHGDFSLQPWDLADENIKASARDGVQFVWPGDTSPEDAHANWMEFKLRDGWKYGPVKDAKAKTHPCLVPYHELPDHQKVKDTLFRSTVLGYKATLD